ncbi:THO complex subunit 5-like protein [Psilocybe cubensis]|uniref:Fms interacting protein n=2 Tax=Psilocybe cubensis TaxID=181762 RepID=A0A8H7Y114_PSICU|nr:THO complex subunit 5-like protein [Psilocybe cubensis]KAH9482677.1 THO complex subunit 5-like protein [Psilocybe cubensis]
MHSDKSSPLPPNPDDVLDQLRNLCSPAFLTHDTAAMHIRAMALIGRLKSLYRAANTATRCRKEETAEARQEMDQSHLNLQNLLYEKRHLEREIEKCRQFASIYQDIPLYTLEEYNLLAPEQSRTEEILADEHQLMLNRLTFELAERQRLDLKKKELMQQKEELLKESKAKSTTMDSVKAHIETLMKTATEIQKKVDELVQPIPTQAGEDSRTMSL